MATLNRVLNVCILIMVVTAAGLSVRLYRLRRTARSRGDALAASVNDAFRQIADREASLDWRTHMREPQQFRRDLQDFEADAAAIREQRDEQMHRIASLQKDLHAERQALLAMQQDLGQARDQIQELTRQKNYYAESLRHIGSRVGAAGNALDSDGLAEIEHRIKGLQTTAEEVAGLRRTVRDQQDYLVEMERTVAKAEMEVQRKSQRLQNLAAIINELPPTIRKDIVAEHAADELINTDPHGSADDGRIQHRRVFVPKPGTIVKVNYDYNYLIIDQGRDDLLPKNVRLTISRDKEYIGEAVISRVYKNYAVAEILPSKTGSLPLEGDAVLFLADPLKDHTR